MIKAPNFLDLEWLDHGFGMRDSVYPPHIKTVRQIHSGIVLDAANLEAPGSAGDALISDQAGVTVGVRTADCVPILLVDPTVPAVAAIHAGWKGSAENIAAAAVREFIGRWKTRPENLRAAIGPSIGVCCYEVGPDVAGRFGTWLPGMDTVEAAVRLDLPAVNEAQLRAEGVKDIWKSGECSFCTVNRFYSFRREREQAGRMLSFIGYRIKSGGSHKDPPGKLPDV